jgi:enamine deaminase RidA (YjgF/YER057c/UK114 family)
MKKMTLEESLQSIAMSISNVTELGQYVNVSSDTPETDLSGVENQLDLGLSNITTTLEEINSNVSELNSNMELIVMQLNRIADCMENKNK